MIKLSKLTDYAIVILADMAREDGACMAASALTTRTGLPEATVSKVLKMLVKGGLITSTRGASGGYVLDRKAEGLKISHIIEAMEGPIALTACVDGSHEGCAIQSCCRVRGRWDPVNTAIRTALDNVTLADMVRPHAPPRTERVTAHVEH